ncbi:hypothetical protein FSP39_005639 [Pinctada imbricata]|uniref:Alpha-mannosidase n=1 Tax=Pinctada imbricata TaxID=66713 RepID=A0AA89BT36_PINIB|nr:hypothetical protein FSP39_005639 [Pinctada imbricata]
MKRYMVVWVGMFFVVVCVSLYLMMETVSSNMGKSSDINTVLIEEKIAKIKSDIHKNKNLINDIKDIVRKMTRGDREAAEKLEKVLRENLNEEEEVDKPQVQVPVVKADIKSPDVKSKGAVQVSEKTCGLAEGPNANSDVQMLQLFDFLKFDNPDGGAWKQGWPVTYEKDRWGKDNVLHVVVIPHTHCDPGWVKTLNDYYHQQVKPILDNMVIKLEQDKRRKFMYAEMSFFSIWWDEISEEKRERVKKLIANKQFEIVTGGWVMNDEANTHYAAMVDQMIEGNQYIHGITGAKPESGWAIDPFGHTPTMAYILKRSGFKNMLIQRVHYSVKKHFAKERSLEFMWRQNWDYGGATDMFCHMMPFYSYDVPHTCGPEPAVCCQFDFARLAPSRYSCPWSIPPKAIDDNNVAKRAKMLIDQYKKKASLYRGNVVLIPLGDDFRYDKLEEWDKQYNNYQKIFDYLKKTPELGVQAEFGTLSDYFNKLYEVTGTAKGSRPKDFPVLSGDFFTYADRDDHYWSGYYTSRPFYKNFDRLLESTLRSAEIAFTLAKAHQDKHKMVNLQSETLMKQLVDSRRSLGLFQHHDAITGTAKDFVVEDYGRRLLTALTDSKKVIVESIAYLTAKKDYKDKVEHMFNLDESREHHDSLPEKNVIAVSSDPVVVLFYNSLGHAREQVVKIHISSPHVKVTDPNGNTVATQTDPYWIDKEEASLERYKVSFVANVPALGVSRYLIKEAKDNQKNVHSQITFYSSEAEITDQGPFHMKTESLGDFTLETSRLEAHFTGDTGLLQSVTMKSSKKTYQSTVSFQSYGARGGKEKSGAYLFLPDGGARILKGHGVIRVVKGPVVSEVTVFMSHVQHVVRLHNSPGTDGLTVDIYNLVDIRDQTNFEMGMKVSTDIKNKDREFCSDLNGFQMQKHKTLDKLPLQANYYPMPAMAYIEDDEHRFSLLTAQSLGVASLKQGEIEVIMDRRLNQDDNRGLGQGVRDNKLTPNRFRLLFEPRNSPVVKEKTDGFPSLQAHTSYLHLIHPLLTIPQREGEKTPEVVPSFSALETPLPCDVHLLNLRTLQGKPDSNVDKYKPKKEAGLLLHRLGLDCALPNSGLQCKDTQGKIAFGDMFKDFKPSKITETSLTLLHEKESISPETSVQLKPMEIHSYRVTW